MDVTLTLPDGSEAVYALPITLGRGSPSCLSDALASRQQFTLSPVEDVFDVVKLDSTGINPVIVEVQHEGSESWEVLDLLDKGMSTLIGPGARFYVASRKETTTFQIKSVKPLKTTGSGPAPAAAQRTAGHQHQASASCDPAPIADRALNLDAELAAALAAAAADDEHHAASPQQHVISDEDDCPDNHTQQHPAKRRKTDASRSAAASQQQKEPADAPGSSGDDDCPVKLLRVRGLAAQWNSGCLGAKLKDIVTGAIQMAVVMNYMIDMGWLLSACPALLKAGSLVVVHGEHHEREAAIRVTAHAAGITSLVCHQPPLPIAYGTHHSKAFLLQYASGMRVVVHTANYIYADCNNKTQGLWTQDFALKAPGSPTTSSFEKDLCDYLRAIALPAATAQAVLQAVAAVDFSSARVALVASVPGYHTGQALHKWGHMRVRSLLAQEQLPGSFSAASPLAVQCSSMGSLDEKWVLSELGTSMAAGRYQQHQAGSRSAAQGAQLAPVFQQQAAAGSLSADQMYFVWPAVDEVRNSVEGWAAGASIPGTDKNVGRPFLQRLFCRFGGEPVGRQRAMPHIKSYCRFQGQQLGWYLVCSHNMSKAAWGTLQKGGSQLMVRSYELGVLVLPSLEAAYQRHHHRGFSCSGGALTAGAGAGSCADGGSVELWSMGAAQQGGRSGGDGQEQGARGVEGVVRVHLPVPYKLPPERYSAGDKPWACDALWTGMDALGQLCGRPVRLYNLREPDE